MSVNAPCEAMLNNDTFNETFDNTPPSSQASQDSSESSDKNFEMDDHTASSQSNISDDREIVQSDGRPLTRNQCISNTNKNQ